MDHQCAPTSVPGEFGYSAETWTYAKLTEHINKTAEHAGFTRLSTLTKTSIKNILDAAEIKPFRIQYYCEKRDPDFEAKMHVRFFSFTNKLKCYLMTMVNCSSLPQSMISILTHMMKSQVFRLFLLRKGLKSN